MGEVVPDFSIGLNVGDQDYKIDAVYDNIHLFRRWGHAIIKVVGEEGFIQIHTSVEDAERVATAAGIIPVDRPSMRNSEYESYLRFKEGQLEDLFNGLEDQEG
jgi:hypothetical protein